MGAMTADDHVNARQNVRSSEDAGAQTSGQTPRAPGLHRQARGREHRAPSGSRGSSRTTTLPKILNIPTGPLSTKLTRQSFLSDSVMKWGGVISIPNLCVGP